MAAPRPLVWLASHPKSGSTWLRFQLHHLLHGPPGSSADVNRGMPSIHDEDPAPWTAALQVGGVMLSHKAPGPHLARLPPGDGVILLVRHPADAVLSDARFFALTQLDAYVQSKGRTVDQATDADIQHLLGLYLGGLLQQGSVPKQRRLGFGSWGEHAAGWLQTVAGRPHVVLRYEDLQRDGEAELRRVCVFLRRPLAPPALRAAVAGSHLSAMKAMQEREITARTPGRFYEARHAGAYKKGLRFVSQGRVGQGLRLPPAALERLGALWAEPMARLGYRMPGAGDPVGPLPPDLAQVVPLRTPWP
jgi:hypothetical protein